MKIGTHNLGGNAVSKTTLARVNAGALTLAQTTPAGSIKEITLSLEQIALLKDVLA